MSRYPYTYAADFVRSFAGPNLSRSDASSIWRGIATALGLDEQYMAKKLADFYRLNEAEATERFIKKFRTNDA